MIPCTGHGEFHKSIKVFRSAARDHRSRQTPSRQGQSHDEKRDMLSAVKIVAQATVVQRFLFSAQSGLPAAKQAAAVLHILWHKWHECGPGHHLL